ncbi:metallophosphoesterase family protein [Riemerella columbina]|uniref:metallophosphoesterase family protein n=1 Tax=Riemerella columbina TaxID=103810 RepID=UPI00266F42C6|nr:metallophosphoesterase family protein [Riemerella columbina]WKS95727.1 metallophosphatase family protein [Riemerella columbina]
MKNILLLSDTHSHLDERILAYAQEADEIWHCGDFGNLQVVDTLAQIKPLRGVYGNIDGADIRKQFPEVAHFRCEEVEVLMIHIGGYPQRYTPLTKKSISEYRPQLFISGHSHILKAMYDHTNQLLHLNPGAAGQQGWHQMRTMMRFRIEGKDINNLEIIELGKK